MAWSLASVRAFRAVGLTMMLICLSSSRDPRPSNYLSIATAHAAPPGPPKVVPTSGGERPRARDLGITPGVLSPGPLNAITDVAGVRVGQVTLIEGERVRTGVTAILPHAGNLFQQKVPGAVFIGNAFGKLAGSTQVEELGTIETPIVLSNTLAVGTVMDTVVGWTLVQPGNENVRSVNALVGETNDGGLNDIRSRPVREEHVLKAIRDARAGEVAEGGVGAGTGTVAFGFKGGIGTSSRVAPVGGKGYVVGVLVQSNFGGVLSVDGVPVGKELERVAARTSDIGKKGGVAPWPKARRGSALRAALALARERRAPRSDPRSCEAGLCDSGAGDGSCMIVVATDAPLSAKDLNRLAARALFGLARTGSSFSNGSGDFSIAFSTAPELRVAHGSTAVTMRPMLPAEALSPLFQAALEATEEAVLNSMLKAETMTANGRTVHAVDIARLKEILKKHGR